MLCTVHRTKWLEFCVQDEFAAHMTYTLDEFVMQTRHRRTKRFHFLWYWNLFPYYTANAQRGNVVFSSYSMRSSVATTVRDPLEAGREPKSLRIIYACHGTKVSRTVPLPPIFFVGWGAATLGLHLGCTPTSLEMLATTR